MSPLSVAFEVTFPQTCNTDYSMTRVLIDDEELDKVYALIAELSGMQSSYRPKGMTNDGLRAAQCQSHCDQSAQESK
jgi:hypothetical protein